MSKRKMNIWSRVQNKEDEAPRAERSIFTPKRINIQYRDQPEASPPPEPVEEEEEEPIEADELLERLRTEQRPKRKKRRSRRDHCISICVCDEDELVFRSAAAEADMKLSEWARLAMYKAAKVKPPKRS